MRRHIPIPNTTTITMPMEITTDALTELKTICKNLAGHPKCPMYAVSHVQAILDGKVADSAYRTGTSMKHALEFQFSYIFSNLGSVRNRQVIALKRQLQAWHERYIDPPTVTH